MSEKSMKSRRYVYSTMKDSRYNSIWKVMQLDTKTRETVEYCWVGGGRIAKKRVKDLAEILNNSWRIV